MPLQVPKSPVFTNLLLADEIHRTPLKTQAAQLEAMLDKRVSSEGEDYHHDAPFFVLKTQNPIKREGTNPLPEAQLDRFLIHILIKYPCAAEELEIIRSVNTDEEQITNQIVDGPTFLKFQHLVRRITVCAGNRRSGITQNLLQHILATHANDSSIAPVIPLLLDRHHRYCLHQVPLSTGGMGL
ncbi:MAG: AAA family ATPase [Akkermansiaceae bacterium]